MIENNNTYIYKTKIITKTYEKEITEIENKIINIQQNEIDKFLITDLTDYENKKYTSINFSIYFYNRILEKYFNFLKIDINDGTLFIANKNEISKKISADTFKYFNKYPKKIKIINFIIKEVIKKLQYENFEQEMEESSIYPYFFKINELKNIENKIIETKTLEIYSGNKIPTITKYILEKINIKRVKIHFIETLDEEKVPLIPLIQEFKCFLNIPFSEPFKFNFIIKGYYIYNKETKVIEKIEVDKEINFYKTNITSNRILELKDFNKIEKELQKGKTYEQSMGEMFEYLELMKNRKVINKQDLINFIDEIAFLERKKVFETVKGYIKTNKIGFLEFLDGERDRIYISEKEVLKVFEEIFEYESLEILSEEKKDEINKKLKAKNQQNGIEKNKSAKSEKTSFKKFKKLKEQTYDSIRDWLLPLLRKDDKIIFPKEEFLERVKLFDETEKLRTFNVIKSAVEHDGYCVKFEEGRTIEGYEVKKIFGKMLGIVVEEEVVKKVEEEEKELTPQQLRKKKFLERLNK